MNKKVKNDDIILKIAISVFIFILPYLIMEGTKQEKEVSNSYNLTYSHSMSDIKELKK